MATSHHSQFMLPRNREAADSPLGLGLTCVCNNTSSPLHVPSQVVALSGQTFQTVLEQRANSLILGLSADVAK